MKILFVASEATPYATSGGLGDVMGALPFAVSDFGDDIEVDVIMPLYKSVWESYGLLLEKAVDVSFNLSWRKSGASVYRIKNGKVNYLFIENHAYFDRERLYGEYDDGERFAFFSMAVIEYIIASGDIPNVLHANDWQSALSIVYLKTKYLGIEELKNIKTLYTIHNIEYQGKFDLSILGDVFDIASEYRNILEYNGEINLTKSAIVLADRVNTVSPNYANELRHDFFSFGLSDIILNNENKICGVLNGIDYSSFSPEGDKDIYFSYTKRGVKSGKAKNKKALQNELSLSVNEKIPLIVMVSRLVSGKGMDLVLCIIEELLQESVQIVILGIGEEKYESFFMNLQERYNNFKALIKFDRVFSKKLYASADILLMPSKSEPCGLAQMIACSYGAVPIVRAVGGLYDTIKPYGTDGANGFTFDNYNAHELLYTVKKAIDVYGDKESWGKLVKGAISSDFSWNGSASEYIKIYSDLMNGR